MIDVMDKIDIKRELAGNAFSVGIRMLSQKKKISIDSALIYIAGKLDRDVLQMGQYAKTGLPIYLIDDAVRLFKTHGIALGRHQLRPTDDVVRIHLT